MDRAIYLAMNGAKQINLAQASNANNMANAATTAFKADLEQFRSQPVFGEVYPSRVYAMTERPGVNLSPAALQATGRDLDVAIDGEGWIAVSGKDGQEAYTRAGDLHVTAQGQLVTGTGLPVVGNGGPIALPPYQKLEIGSDGTVSIIPQGGNATVMAALDQIKLVNPAKDQLEKGEDGLMHVKGGQAAAASPQVRLLTGNLEASNVNIVEEMVQMIDLQRQYEMHIKLMKSVEDDGAASSQLLKLG
ncbi:MAG: flagellar basal-body rod protein FlgF [Methylococcaceae bacterium]|nr:flagellar basal-body rod protein FlgF [Methylococcaceae bacterium]